jgi:hypothetical protein
MWALPTADGNKTANCTVTVIEEPINYPIEIPFEDYSLTGTLCEWRLGLQGSNVIAIDSNEELENYIICTGGAYPAIDFLEHTLLLAWGFLPSRPAILTETSFLKNSRNEYTLNLIIFQGPLHAPTEWHFAFLVPKVATGAIVTLDVTYDRPF